MKGIDLERLARYQLKLSRQLKLSWSKKIVKLVAGSDFSYDLTEKKITAFIAVFKFPELKMTDKAWAVKEVRFPYISSYLAFREAPAFFEAFRKLKASPDVTLVDGNGIAHPRKMGLASFVGVILDICTIGCAKRPVFPFIPPGKKRGSYTFLFNDSQEKVGVCLRTRTDVKPIFVSPGHKIDFSHSIQLVLRCAFFRIPEPLRQAHILAKRLKTIF